MRVAMIQRMICHYQVPYYILLNKDLQKRRIDLKVFCGTTQDKECVYKDTFFVRLPQIKFDINIGGLRDRLVILPTLLAALVKYKPDVVVTEDISAMPNCITILFYCRMFRIPYIVRGPGSIPNKKPSRLRFLLDPIITPFRNGAQSILCYSCYAKDYYSTRYKKRCYIAYNSTMPRHSISEYRRIESNIKLKYKNHNPFNIAFVGRLIPQKKVDLLLTALSKVQTDLPIRLSVVGDGNIKDHLSELSLRLNISEKVQFLGEIYDHSEKMKIFMNTHLGVLPGLGGLAIQEMMWYGIPVIASSADGTEQDLLVEGNAGIYIENMSVEELSKAFESFFEMEYEEKIKMALKALNVVYDKYNLSSMISAFEKAVMNDTTV